MIDKISPDLIVADVVDDHRNWPNITKEKFDMFDTNYKKILSMSELNLFNCHNNLVKFSPYCTKGKSFVIPNGADIDFSKGINSPKKKSVLNDKILRDIKAYRKVIGYFGNLESKFDWDLVEKAASEFPDCIFLLAGSTHVASQGSRRANIKLVGAYKYDDLASVASHFDLAIVRTRRKIYRLNESS